MERMKGMNDSKLQCLIRQHTTNPSENFKASCF